MPSFGLERAFLFGELYATPHNRETDLLMQSGTYYEDLAWLKGLSDAELEELVQGATDAELAEAEALLSGGNEGL